MNDDPLPGATVTYTVDGGEVRMADCVDGSSAEECTVFAAGWEVDGEFLVTVELDGYIPIEETVTVTRTEDDCHVVGETLDVVMEPAVTDCRMARCG